MNNLFQVNYETALENYNILLNLPPKTKLYVDSNNKLYLESRWFSGVRRYADGSSRKDIIQPIYQTFMRLVGKNEISKEDMMDCLDSVEQKIKETYGEDFGDFNNLVEDIRKYIKECATPKDKILNIPTHADLEDAIDSLSEFNNANISISDAINVENVEPKNVENVENVENAELEVVPQIDVEEIIRDAREKARQRLERETERNDKLKEAFNNMLEVLNEVQCTSSPKDESNEPVDSNESFEYEDSDESDKSDDFVKYSVNNIISSFNEGIDEVGQSIEKNIDKISHSVSKGVRNVTNQVNDNVNTIIQHADEVRINIGDFEFIDSNEYENNCIDNFVNNISNSLFSSFSGFMNDLAFTFGSNSYKED